MEAAPARPTSGVIPSHGATAATYLPLSFGQQCVLLNESTGTPGGLNQHCAVPLRPAPRNESSVRQLLRSLQARHDAFRSRLVRRGRRVGLAFHDLDDVPEIDLVTGPLEDPRQWCATPFTRGEAPLLRARLRQRDGLAWLHFAVDHLIFDGWSYPLLAQEVTNVWQSLTAGSEAGRAPGSYQAYLAAQGRHSQPEPVAAYRAFWAEQFHRDAVLHLPRGPSSGCYRLGFGIPEAISARLPMFRRDLRLTDFLVFLAAFATALAGSAGDTSLLIHSAVADRSQPGSADTIGCLLNFIAIRVQVGDHLEDTAVSCRSGLLHAMQHQAGPFFEFPGRGHEDGAVLFAQPRLYGGDPWTPPAASTDPWIMEESPPLLYGDISFGFRPTPWGYAAGFSFEECFLDREAAPLIGHRLIEALDLGTSRRTNARSL